MTKEYKVIAVTDLTQDIIDICDQSTITSALKSLDNTLCIVKYNTPAPAAIAAVSGSTYDQPEILVLILSGSW